MYYLTVLEATTLKVRGCVPSKTHGGILPCLFLASGGFQAAFDLPWLVAAALPSLPSLLAAFSWVAFCPHMFPYNKHQLYWLEVHPTPVCPHLFFCLFVFVFLSFVVLGLHSQHMEVPRLGVELELRLLAYATATATPDPEPHLRLTPQLTATPDP